jgi:hypothetical protein
MTELDRPQPYIGVSGVAHCEQHIALFDVALRERIDRIGYFMIIGVQATGKTQVREVESKRGRMWHPVGDEIAEAAASEDSGLTKPYVHCFFTDDEMAIGVANVMRRTRHYVQGMQFNGLHWTEQDYRGLFTGFAETYPGKSIILQANSGVLNANTPSELARNLVGMPVDYVLLDPSGGYGQRMDADKIREYVNEIYQQQVPIGVAIAGGLDAQNIEELFGPMAADFPGLSCDAEGRLRKGPEGATELDLQKAEEFILAWENVVTG